MSDTSTDNLFLRAFYKQNQGKGMTPSIPCLYNHELLDMASCFRLCRKPPRFAISHWRICTPIGLSTPNNNPLMCTYSAYDYTGFNKKGVIPRFYDSVKTQLGPTKDKQDLPKRHYGIGLWPHSLCLYAHRSQSDCFTPFETCSCHL